MSVTPAFRPKSRQINIRKDNIRRVRSDIDVFHEQAIVRVLFEFGKQVCRVALENLRGFVEVARKFDEFDAFVSGWKRGHRGFSGVPLGV